LPIGGDPRRKPRSANTVLLLTDDVRADELEHKPKTQSLIVE